MPPSLPPSLLIIEPGFHAEVGGEADPVTLEREGGREGEREGGKEGRKEGEAMREVGQCNLLLSFSFPPSLPPSLTWNSSSLLVLPSGRRMKSSIRGASPWQKESVSPSTWGGGGRGGEREGGKEGGKEGHVMLRRTGTRTGPKGGVHPPSRPPSLPPSLTSRCRLNISVESLAVLKSRAAQAACW